jgi:hypothetical protein
MRGQRMIRNRGIHLALAVLLVLQLVAGFWHAPLVSADNSAAGATAMTGMTASFVDQPGGKTSWYLTGLANWNNADANWKFKHLTGGFYAYEVKLAAGKYEFKLTKPASAHSF